MTHDLWAWVLPALVIALIFYLTAKASIGSYFRAKEGFVERMMSKLKRGQ